MDQNSDKTVIKPRPGGKPNSSTSISQSDKTMIRPRPRPGLSKTSEPFDDRTLIRPKPSGMPMVHAHSEENEQASQYQSELLHCAGRLLSFQTQLRQLYGKVDTDKLHQKALELLKRFRLDAAKVMSDLTLCEDASYVLCSLIDETVLNSAWSEGSQWSQKPLLSVFHKETYGGEKVFLMLEKSLETPSTHAQLIELIYIVLSMGFMGKLRIDPQGIVKAEQYRSQAYQALSHSRRLYKKTLSVQVQPATGFKQKLFTFLPIWFLLASLILAGFSVYSYWLIELNKQSDETLISLATLIPVEPPAQLPETMVPEAVKSIGLKELLLEEINQSVLRVEEYDGRTSIVLQAAELFPSGSPDVNIAFHPILNKIAQALEMIEGRIVVIGHTDNVQIRSARFPSNYQLSLARANAVVEYLRQAAQLKGRLISEGKGESEPIASNDSDQGRAQNRRVVIDIYHQDT